MDSQDLPVAKDLVSLAFTERHPILSQAWDDAIHLSWQQMGVPVLGVLSSLLVTLAREYKAGHLHGWPDAQTFVYQLLWSALIGIALYAVVAVIRAPFIVLGRQNRRLIELGQNISDLESRPVVVPPSLLTDGSALHQPDSAEPNIVMRLDGGMLSAWGVQEIIYEGDYSTSYKVIVIRCKNERDSSPPRKVGGVGNVSAEISFTGYGEKHVHIPGDLGAWLREYGERVNFPVGVTHRLVVAKLEDEKLCAVQRRSNQNKTTVWVGDLDDTNDYFRVKVALYADSERKPLARGDYILERDGRLFGRDETFAGPQLVSTSLWRSSRALKFQIRLHEFLKLDSDGVSRDGFDQDYKACETEAAKFIEQHYGNVEKRHFLFERDDDKNQPPNPFRRLRREPSSFRERVDAQLKQLDRLEKISGL
ncbi:MAG: hypothetical protein QOF62_3289 [Pyrinomonadaceae bacterium]|jgi:hypothetical protein|nr:hypothetical protein [Pyrinomonadaceae bacterium]